MPLPLKLSRLVSFYCGRDGGLALATLRYEHEIAFPAPAPARLSAIRANLPALFCDAAPMLNYQTNAYREPLVRFKVRLSSPQTSSHTV
jgi:hypothetical protein